VTKAASAQRALDQLRVVSRAVTLPSVVGMKLFDVGCASGSGVRAVLHANDHTPRLGPS
jgi:hypothetical protein